ncbi:hypothetical protein LB542_16470 [Mesorhizobium sp. BR1-1-9]|uniref:hypothetical protein n=1 Tax=unclassified Mesorhizobium TaxID=325217 RepID=UPI0015E46DE9|nr:MULTISPECIES: hypothetical protein [unclassified Mesorhizobium]MBZ9807833.1 hypothetical protein [Mesorhizobium sp. ESP-6-2]MBZ9872446.1 hypothetical protein [Mesorhizobium sp. BR1-1-9]MBZ9941838.1 hypothetical protein [Mesorhizobium sp. BR1-1-13]
MQIRTTANSTPQARAASAAAQSAEARRIGDDVAQARHTAMSALTNDRFRIMLEQITDPVSSGALMTMRGDHVVDLKSAQSSYADNSE